LAALKLRDRDAITTSEGLVFRVFGNSHPSDAYICDVEYAPSEIFNSKNPKAYRSNGQNVFYKFYEDEGLKFVKEHYPQHIIFHEMLQAKVAGVNLSNIAKVKKPYKKLEEIMERAPRDELIAALRATLEFTLQYSSLSAEDFGVFGSLLHDFYHPRFSDLDFIVYGRKKLAKLRESLQELYLDKCSLLKNEFESNKPIKGKHWRFQNFSAEEFVWHQQRKLIYALFKDRKSGRVIKTEYEPVKDWKEIDNEYDSDARILQKGWAKIIARIVDDSDAPFIPSIYGIEPLRILDGLKKAEETVRIISFMEEFRMQAFRDEKVYVEGNLEEVVSPKGSCYQIALTYCPRYYEQALKVAP
jgi:predicted nucleotidyltransferase